jgi:methylenetetrahydrofolate dehydrogenase (NADP+)/methenyltetrahydrofolate cyclohydrolase
METDRIIDGKNLAAKLRDQVAAATTHLKEKHQLTPGLAAVLVGEDPASEVYIRNKNKQTVDVGMASLGRTLPTQTDQAELLTLIDQLNEDRAIHGILIQLPLPAAIDPNTVMDAISPEKDVDGFNLLNVGLLSTNRKGLVPCTPLGCLMLLKDRLGNLEGLNAIIVGRSNIVGKPLAQLLLRENCTVTVAHSRTRETQDLCRNADILVAAVGQPEMIRGDWIKPGATVLDVGINRVPGTKPGKTKLIGDVAFNEAINHVGGITPVPGGVGPMTIACLLRNTVIGACIQNNIQTPDI